MERRCRCDGPACNPWHGRGHWLCWEGLCIHCRDVGARIRSAVLDLEVGDIRRGGRCCPRQLHTGVVADVQSRDRDPQTPVKSVTITVTIVPTRGPICYSRTPAADSNSACAPKRALETAEWCIPLTICQSGIKCNCSAIPKHCFTFVNIWSEDRFLAMSISLWHRRTISSPWPSVGSVAGWLSRPIPAVGVDPAGLGGADAIRPICVSDRSGQGGARPGPQGSCRRIGWP